MRFTKKIKKNYIYVGLMNFFLVEFIKKLCEVRGLRTYIIPSLFIVGNLIKSTHPKFLPVNFWDKRCYMYLVDYDIAFWFWDFFSCSEQDFSCWYDLETEKAYIFLNFKCNFENISLIEKFKIVCSKNIGWFKKNIKIINYLIFKDIEDIDINSTLLRLLYINFKFNNIKNYSLLDNTRNLIKPKEIFLNNKNKQLKFLLNIFNIKQLHLKNFILKENFLLYLNSEFIKFFKFKLLFFKFFKMYRYFNFFPSTKIYYVNLNKISNIFKSKIANNCIFSKYKKISKNIFKFKYKYKK